MLTAASFTLISLEVRAFFHFLSFSPIARGVLEPGMELGVSTTSPPGRRVVRLGMPAGVCGSAGGGVADDGSSAAAGSVDGASEGAVEGASEGAGGAAVSWVGVAGGEAADAVAELHAASDGTADGASVGAAEGAVWGALEGGEEGAAASVTSADRLVEAVALWRDGEGEPAAREAGGERFRREGGVAFRRGLAVGVVGREVGVREVGGDAFVGVSGTEAASAKPCIPRTIGSTAAGAAGAEGSDGSGASMAKPAPRAAGASMGR